MNSSNSPKHILSIAVKILVLVGLAWFVFVTVKDIVVTGFYFNYVDQLAQKTHLNPYVINILAALGFIPYAIGVRDYFSFSEKHRTRGAVLLLTMTVIYNGALYMATKNDIIGKYYAIAPTNDRGVLISDQPSNDGYEWHKITRANQWYVLKLGKGKPVIPAGRDWFDQRTGLPLLWYLRAGTEVRFYDGPGFDRYTGENLIPVSKQFHDDYAKISDQTAVDPISQPQEGLSGNSPSGQGVDKTHSKLTKAEDALVAIASCKNELRRAFASRTTQGGNAAERASSVRYGIAFSLHLRRAARNGMDLQAVSGEEAYARLLYGETGIAGWSDVPAFTSCLEQRLRSEDGSRLDAASASTVASTQDRSSNSAAPSFDCSKATTRVEKSICADNGLAQADLSMAAAYRARVQMLSGTALQAFKTSHRQWLSEYQIRCNSVNDAPQRAECIHRSLRDYTKQLQARATGVD